MFHYFQMHVLGELGSINGEKQILSQDEHWGPLLHHHSMVHMDEQV